MLGPSCSQTLVLTPLSLGIAPNPTASHALSVEVARVTMRSLKTKVKAEQAMATSTSGARTWCADNPAAFIATTSLFWLSVDSVISVASSTEYGRNRATSCGNRSETYVSNCACPLPGAASTLPLSLSRSSICKTSVSISRTARIRTANILAM